MAVNVSAYLPPLARLVCPDHVNELGHVVLDGSPAPIPQLGPLTRSVAAAPGIGGRAAVEHDLPEFVDMLGAYQPGEGREVLR